MADTPNTDYKQVDEIPDEAFEDILLPNDRPPASLTDLQYLYGRFVLLGQQFNVDTNLTPSQQATVTIQEANGIINEEQGIVYLNIRIDRDKKTLTPTGTTVMTLTEWHAEKTAFAYYDSARGVDHSITQKTGGDNGPETVATERLEKVTRKWPNEDPIANLVGEHPDGWIIGQLQTLHNHPNIEDITDELQATLNGSKHRLIAPRFYTDESPPPDGKKTEWKYPADIDVLLKGMEAQQKHKWATKNQSNSRGEAAGYVNSDDPNQTVFGMAPDPLSVYTGKKRAWMPRLNRDESAAAHPITGDVSGAITQSTPLLDACSQPHGLSLYHLPYFDGEQTVEKMQWLYQILWDTHIDKQKHEKKSDDETTDTWDSLETIYRKLNQGDLPAEIAKSLRVWTVGIVNVQSSRKRAIVEIKDGNIPQYIKLAESAQTIGGELGRSDLFETYDWDFATGSDKLQLVTSPRYTFDTTITTTDEDDIDANQPGYRFYKQLLADKEIKLSELLEAYTAKIDDQYRSNLSSGDDYPVPSYSIIQQFAQLCVLSDNDNLLVDILSEETTQQSQNSSETPQPQQTDTQVDDPQEINPAEQFYQIKSIKTLENNTQTEVPHMPQESQSDTTAQDVDTTNGSSRAEAERLAYETMIEEQAALANNPQRRAAFTLGSLITTVSGHQRSRDVEPLSAKLSPSTISKHNIEEYVTEIIELINRYATTDDKQWRYTTQTSQLTEDLTDNPPAEWELSSSDIQYHIALGMAFGAEQHTHPAGAETDNEQQSLAESTEGEDGEVETEELGIMDN